MSKLNKSLILSKSILSTSLLAYLETIVLERQREPLTSYLYQQHIILKELYNKGYNILIEASLIHKTIKFINPSDVKNGAPIMRHKGNFRLIHEDSKTA